MLEHSEWSDCKWVPTNMNSADDALRGLRMRQDFWMKGPAVLYKAINSWPKQETTNMDNCQETKKFLQSFQLFHKDQYSPRSLNL